MSSPSSVHKPLRSLGFRNLAWSLFFHAGIVAGVFCGMSGMDEDSVDETEAAPVFFEILEESMIAAAGDVAVNAEETPGENNRDAAEVEPAQEKEVQPSDEPAVPEEIPAERKHFHAETVPAEHEAVERVAVSKPEETATAEGGVNADQALGGDSDVVESVPEPVVAEDVDTAEPVLKESPVRSGDAGEQLKNNASDAVDASSQEEERAKIVSAPVAFGRIVPRYPRSARRRGREGTVTVKAHVSASGEVTGAEVVAGSGHKDLDAAAVSAVRSARFSPATEDGVKVHGQIRLTFEFKLR